MGTIFWGIMLGWTPLSGGLYSLLHVIENETHHPLVSFINFTNYKLILENYCLTYRGPIYIYIYMSFRGSIHLWYFGWLHVWPHWPALGNSWPVVDLIDTQQIIWDGSRFKVLFNTYNVFFKQYEIFLNLLSKNVIRLMQSQ